MTQGKTDPVVILGGGLAGIAAGLWLSRQGRPVTLLEARKRLGGRATSFTDATTGRDLDNCQHVVMECCTHLLHLYEQLGVLGDIQWHDRFHFCDGQGRMDELSADDLPAPLHLGRSLMGFVGLGWGEKIAIARGMWAMMRADRAPWRDRSFADWLAEHRQPAGAVEKFWRPVVVGAINETLERMAGDVAIQVFQEGFLRNEQAYRMGLPAVPLVRLYDKVTPIIEQAGGSVLLQTAAMALLEERGRIVGVDIGSDEPIRGSAYVSALPFDRLDRITPPALKQMDTRLASLEQFETSPIIGLHLWLACEPDALPVSLPHVALTQSPLHWIFNHGYDASVGGQHLHGVISAAHDYLGTPANAMAKLAMAEVHRAFPSTCGATLLGHLVVKERQATFSARPGLGAHRPTTRGSVANLYLAGDWCDTGWPATMEGAVRSGYRAGVAILEDAGLAIPGAGDDAPLVADLPASPWYVAMGGRG